MADRRRPRLTRRGELVLETAGALLLVALLFGLLHLTVFLAHLWSTR